ncbi:helicase-related protein [Aureimonas leprariae]|nr:helicase-related protein [Aureimonas leprariae]
MRSALVDGLSPAGTAEIVAIDWLGTDQVSVTFRTPRGLDERVLQRIDEDGLRPTMPVRPFAFDGDGEDFRLAAEAHRIALAHLFDPYLALTNAEIEPLPHQITAVYGEMLPRQPLRFLLADDPGAGKTIMAGLLIKELILRGDLKRCLIVAPGSLVEQWQDELQEKFALEFRIVTRDMLRAGYRGNPFAEHDRLILRLDMGSRSEEMQERIDVAKDFDLVICDEAHRMSATHAGGEVKYTRRFQFGRRLARRARHFLLMTATPHNGHDDDFQLFLSLLDGDRFEGGHRDGVRTANASDLMRRLIKEELYWFDGRPLFPERRAYTASYMLSAAEAELYAAVTDYVREEMNRAERFAAADGRKRTSVGFALQSLQRRLASSPRAIWRSLSRRRERLQRRLEEERLATGSGVQAPAAAGRMTVPDDDDLDEMAEAELEALENEAIDTASSARTLAELATEIESLSRLEAMADALRGSGEDAKWRQLAAILDGPPVWDPATGRGRKILIFTEPRDTLDYLAERIATRLGDPDAVRVIHGGVPREQRRAAVAAFNDDPAVRVLVANDAAGEGVNLQRGAHLMVNYDLPWNPNRLEQRFGRIHRIGQTEVCHLWNLVAGETREGAVYQRLLEKLEEARRALGGKVYDVLGEAFEGTSLRNLLMEAVRYGERPEVKERLDRRVDGAVDREHLAALTARAQLARETMTAADVAELKREMERAHARRLQPHYVQGFFLEAFARLGGLASSRELGRFEIARVPALVRNRDHLAGGGGDPVLERYNRVAFEKAHVRGAAGEPAAALIAPGHPLLRAVIDLTIETYGSTLRRGAILVSDTWKDAVPRLLFMADHEVRDGVLGPDGRPRTISKRLQFVSLDEDGAGRDDGAAPYHDLRPATAAERALLEPVLAAEWLKGDWREKARSYAAEHLAGGHLREVRDRRLAHIRKVEDEVRLRLRKEIAYWSRRAEQHRLNVKAGKDERLALSRAEERANGLADRLEVRLAELKAERDIVAAPPTIVAGALVVPAAMLDALQRRDDPTPNMFAEDTTVSEQLAMDAVMAAERAAGRTPTDVSRHNRGWDIESLTLKGELIFLEVKGRAAGGEAIIVTKNEMLRGLNAGARYNLVYVPIEAGFAHAPIYVTDPARHLWNEPRFAERGTILSVREIVALGQPQPQTENLVPA